MGFSRMSFAPAEGLRSTGTYPATPASEDEARGQIQGRLDEVRDYINDTLLGEMQNAETGASGAERIGSAAIQNVEGATVRAQIADLKEQIDSISAGSVADGTITEAKLADEAVTEDKLAAGAVTALKIADGAVTAAKLAAGAMDGANLVNGSVTGEKIAGSAVGPAKIADYAVTEMKLGTGAVTETKIGTGAVSAAKLATNAVDTANIKEGAVTVGKLAADAVETVKIKDGVVTAAKLGTLDYLTMGPSKQIRFNGTANYIYYDSSANKLMLKVGSYIAVQLGPILYGTGEPTPGTYPAGTIYIQHEQ
jgi:hypothetical protein